MPVSQGHQICLILNSSPCVILTQPFRRWFISSGRCNKSVFPCQVWPAVPDDAERGRIRLSSFLPSFLLVLPTPALRELIISCVRFKVTLLRITRQQPLRQRCAVTLINHNILFNILFPVQHIVRIHHGSNQYRPFYCKPVSWCSSLGH